MTAAPLFDEATREDLRLACQALDLAERAGQPHLMCEALVCVAHAYVAAEAWTTAESYLEQALRWARAAPTIDHTVDLLCSLCELAVRVAAAQEENQPGRAHAARERARDHAYEAATLVGRVADPDWEIKVLLRISDVLDRCGDRDDAVQMQARALRLMAHEPGSAPEHQVLPGLGRLADS